MSAPDAIARLQTFIKNRPALQNVPLFFVAGSVISPNQALTRLKKKQNVDEIIKEMNKKTLTTKEQEKALVIAHYRSLKAQGVIPKVLWFSESPFPIPTDIDGIIREIQNDTPVGRQLINSHLHSLRQHALRKI